MRKSMLVPSSCRMRLWAPLRALNLVEAQGSAATPVDYKRGIVPDVPGNAYDPERVQLCVQGLLLRASGYQCDEGILYFVASKRRVRGSLRRWAGGADAGDAGLRPCDGRWRQNPASA